MRKALFAFIGIFGFILVFCISGLISYYLFPDDLGAAAPDNIYTDEEAMAQINLTGNKPANTAVPDATGPQEEEMLTIVTPSLDRTQALIRRGTIADVLPGTGTEPTDAMEFIYAEEPEGEAAEANKAGGSETVQSGGSSQTGSASGASNTGSNQSSSQEAPNTQQQEAPHQEEVQPETPQEVPQTSQLNPNIQTSDTGL